MQDHAWQTWLIVALLLAGAEMATLDLTLLMMAVGAAGRLPDGGARLRRGRPGPRRRRRRRRRCWPSSARASSGGCTPGRRCRTARRRWSASAAWSSSGSPRTTAGSSSRRGLVRPHLRRRSQVIEPGQQGRRRPDRRRHRGRLPDRLGCRPVRSATETPRSEQGVHVMWLLHRSRHHRGAGDRSCWSSPCGSCRRRAPASSSASASTARP